MTALGEEKLERLLIAAAYASGDIDGGDSLVEATEDVLALLDEHTALTKENAKLRDALRMACNALTAEGFPATAYDLSEVLR